MTTVREATEVGSLLYRCRACHAVYRLGAKDYPMASLEGFKQGQAGSGNLGPDDVRPTDIHRCSARMRGLADFAGIEMGDGTGGRS